MRIALVMCALVICFAPAAIADSFINAGFETGNLAGWSKVGDATAVTSSFGVTPPGGNYQVYVTNQPGFLGANDQVVSSWAGLSANVLNSFSGQLYGPGHNAWTASAIQQSFMGNAGEVLSFNWEYLTNDGPSYDFAFVVVDGSLSLLAKFSATAQINPLNLNASPFFKPTDISGFSYASAYSQFSTTLTTSGNHYIAIGVMNTIDDQRTSAVLLDNFSVGSVPEPSTALLLLSGLSVLAGIKFVRGRQRDNR